MNSELWLFNVLDYLNEYGIITDISELDRTGKLEVWYQDTKRRREANNKIIKENLISRLKKELSEEEQKILGI
jgi:hypothetical protein